MMNVVGFSITLYLGLYDVYPRRIINELMISNESMFVV